MGAIRCHGNQSSDPIWPKTLCSQSPPQWCSRWNLITIGQLVSEIFMFESVDTRTDRWTPDRVPYYKLILSLRLWWAKNRRIRPKPSMILRYGNIYNRLLHAYPLVYRVQTSLTLTAWIVLKDRKCSHNSQGGLSSFLLGWNRTLLSLQS